MIDKHTLRTTNNWNCAQLDTIFQVKKLYMFPFSSENTFFILKKKYFKATPPRPSIHTSWQLVICPYLLFFLQ